MYQGESAGATVSAPRLPAAVAAKFKRLGDIIDNLRTDILDLRDVQREILEIVDEHDHELDFLKNADGTWAMK